MAETLASSIRQRPALLVPEPLVGGLVECSGLVRLGRAYKRAPCWVLKEQPGSGRKVTGCCFGARHDLVLHTT